MTYASQQDMVDRFGEREVIMLTDRDNSGVIDTPLLARMLETADDEINPYLQAKYTIPLVNTPPIVRKFACDIARYRCCGAEVTETEEIRNRYKDAIKFLEKVSRGEISLGLDGLNVPQASNGSVLLKSNNPVFNAETLSDY